MVTKSSDADTRYNCIAWAAGDLTKFWWPSGPYFWPVDVPREETIEAFVRAYSGLGYERCADCKLESGYEKVALYTLNDVPKHAARQLNTGRWTSKLGRHIDVVHDTPEALFELTRFYDFRNLRGDYGTASIFLKRRGIPNAEPPIQIAFR